MEWLRRVEDLLGYQQQEMDLSAGETALRALLVYGVVLVIVRLGDKRFIGRNTAFDMVLAILIGSVGARAITGNAPVLPSISAAAVLVGLHWVATKIAFHATRFGRTVKGHSRVLVEDGEVREDAMRKSGITRHDLYEAIRRQGRSEIDEVATACLERNGSISVVPKRSRTPRVVEVKVEAGVQTVRLEVG